MKVAIYVRVSSPLAKETDNEEIKKKQKQDVEMQLYSLNEYVSNKLSWMLTDTYVEYASSVKHRPIFLKMMEDARKGKFDCIVVWKIDRFARSIQDFFYWIKELDRWEVRLIVYTQNIDTDKQSPTGKLMMTILAAFAEFEREIIIERINASIAMRRAKGLPIGRTKIIGRIDEMSELHKMGMSYRNIGKKMNLDKTLVMRRIKEYDKKNPGVKTETSEEDIQEILLFDNNNI